MGKNNLYVVYAGDIYGCKPVYENTKREKAESYAHLLRKDKNSPYSRIYIETKPLTRYNKRDIDWD